MIKVYAKLLLRFLRKRLCLFLKKCNSNFAYDVDIIFDKETIPPLNEVIIKKRAEVHALLKQGTPHCVTYLLEMEKNPVTAHLNPVRVQICSDLHVEFYDTLPKLLKPSAPYVAFLGDIGVVNHPNYDKYLMQEAENFQKIFVVAGTLYCVE